MVKRLTPILLLFCLGCDGLIVTPNNSKNKLPTPPVVVKTPVTQAAYFNDFADYVESGELETTQRLVLVCSKGLHKAGLMPPLNYDAVMQPYAVKNAPIDATLRAKIVRDLRGLAE